MKNLTIWTRYGELGASSRLRYYQLVPYLEQRGWSVKIHNFFTDEYLQQLYQNGSKNIAELWRSWQTRRRQMAQTAPDVPALIEYELLPFLPYILEKNFLSRRKYVLNFDDAVDLRYRKIPVLCRKYPRLLTHAAGVITANEVLSRKFRNFNKNICKIPTVPPPLIPAAVDKPAKFTLLWIGTPVTFAYLYERRTALQLAAQQCDFELLIVGGGQAVPGVQCQVIPWSENAENMALQRAHAGIMPLPDTPFARGKSAYKLIRYLQAGLPSVASPVGENCQVVQDGKTGFFAQSDSQWAEQICRLADPQLREIMRPAVLSESGKYTLDHAAEQLDTFLAGILTGYSH